MSLIASCWALCFWKYFRQSFTKQTTRLTPKFVWYLRSPEQDSWHGQTWSLSHPWFSLEIQILRCVGVIWVHSGHQSQICSRTWSSSSVHDWAMASVNELAVSKSRLMTWSKSWLNSARIRSKMSSTTFSQRTQHEGSWKKKRIKEVSQTDADCFWSEFNVRNCYKRKNENDHHIK